MALLVGSRDEEFVQVHVMITIDAYTPFQWHSMLLMIMARSGVNFVCNQGMWITLTNTPLMN